MVCIEMKLRLMTRMDDLFRIICKRTVGKHDYGHQKPNFPKPVPRAFPLPLSRKPVIQKRPLPIVANSHSPHHASKIDPDTIHSDPLFFQYMNGGI